MGEPNNRCAWSNLPFDGVKQRMDEIIRQVAPIGSPWMEAETYPIPLEEHINIGLKSIAEQLNVHTASEETFAKVCDYLPSWLQGNKELTNFRFRLLYAFFVASVVHGQIGFRNVISSFVSRAVRWGIADADLLQFLCSLRQQSLNQHHLHELAIAIHYLSARLMFTASTCARNLNGTPLLMPEKYLEQEGRDASQVIKLDEYAQPAWQSLYNASFITEQRFSQELDMFKKDLGINPRYTSLNS